MDEIRIKQIVEETMRNYIGQLIEYAHPRKQFIERAEGLFVQIVIHDCLIHYHNIIGDDKCIPHWKTEMLGWIDNLINMQIKSNDDATTRYKALMSALENLGYMDNVEQIQRTCFLKARKEGVDVKSQIFLDAITLTQMDLKYLVQFIAEKDILKVDDFLNKN